eukprot:CAMPEP_0204253398 /NCGR_PEP_ID=MMETSP0468-20130131/1852_1 /ASSEMBLY_ACC=CAM_ASM_000383 /TAXON_ID=2969 /ORGANISM="Oxyrrhis marina" /LENGTH=275 /DNA_ID=CAMNT_0051226969 /DNA_START=24 /DNA_END=851 /DNA_ORIENTATION=-
MRLVSLAALAVAGDWETTTNDKGHKVQSLKVEAPMLTEEDQYGSTLPPQYRCDACRAVFHHLNAGFAAKHSVSNPRRLKAFEVVDVVDDICGHHFKGYGLSFRDGKNVLSGPGLKRDEPAAGGASIQMGGETWEKRLGEVCRRIVYDDIGEEEMYAMYFKSEPRQLSDAMCHSDLRMCKVGPDAPAAVPKQPAKGKKSKKPKKSKPSTVADAGDSTSSNKDAGDNAAFDAQSFLQRLESQHGETAGSYTRSRSHKDWEKFFVAVAGKIFSDRAEL